MSRKHLLAVVLGVFVGVFALLAGAGLAVVLLPSDPEPSITIESINGQSTANEDARLDKLQEHCSGDLGPDGIASKLDTAPLTLNDELVYMVYGDEVTALNPQALVQCDYEAPVGDSYVSVSIDATSFDDGQAYWDKVISNTCEGGCDENEPSDHPNNVDDSFVVDGNHATFINVKRERTDFDGPQSPVGTLMVVSTIQGDTECSAVFRTGDIQPESFTRVTDTLRAFADQACELAAQSSTDET
ncbi:MAG TPA: hypothetical protein VK694_05630 [Verrucomicrobiae bacterium]|nr:hypothetical protein [Verrucomicrobiae bacterium]